ncbi:MAG TPA: heterodisulfide reductase subunit F [Armatimonadetes bacterium]|nr:heterodisulfide reductase subunit F [Armatimonadota bacterium]
MDNIYRPYLMRVTAIKDETPDVRTLRLEFQDEAVRQSFRFRTGQFGEYSVFGAGECVFCISSPETCTDYIECSFKLMGKVTTALRQVEVGDTIGFRGPYGNWFPLDELQGKNMVFAGGGIGMAPIRSVFQTCLDRREEFGDLLLINGARSVADLVYKAEMEEWAKREDVTVVKTVDPGGEDESWDGKVGFVPTVVEELAPSPENAVAITCGPPIMIKFMLPVLDRLGFQPEQIITTLENKMKCGLGKCGRCNIGGVYVCKDGPVFTAAQLAQLPADF